MKFFEGLFGQTPDNRDQRDENAERKVSVPMPLAGMGAEIAADHVESETEKELRKAAGEKLRRDYTHNR